MKDKNLRTAIIVLVVLAVIVVTIILLLNQNSSQTTEVGITGLATIVKEYELKVGEEPLNIEVRGDNVTATIGETVYESRKESEQSLSEFLNSHEIPREKYSITTLDEQSTLSRIGGFLITFLPIILIVGILIFFLRQARSGGNQALGFGKSKAKLYDSTLAKVTFKDVAGVPEAKEELKEIVDFLKRPEQFFAIGAKIPKGVLLIGSPGTGKTLLARAVAGEAGVPFFSISGSEFVEMFVGVGASRVRDLFDNAKKNSPCIIFIDEIDAVGRQRGTGLGGGHDEREQTLNQILVEMDGFDSRSSIIIIAATNRPDVLDPALLRPGRFDRRVSVDSPDLRGREAILNVHMRGKPFAQDADVNVVASQTPGFSGADLANLVNEAAILAVRRGKKEIDIADLTEAIDRVSIGPARKSKVQSKEERELVAYHEAGHALVSHLIPEGKEVGKVSIISRGKAGGFTRYKYDDNSLHTEQELKALIASAVGGRQAEVLKFKKVTIGASSDIQHATHLAKDMVTQYGMSAKIGLRSMGKRNESVFLGRELGEQKDYSEKLAEQADEEINRLLNEASVSAMDILKENENKLDRIAEYLLKYETIEANQFQMIVDGLEPTPPKAIQVGIERETKEAVKEVEGTAKEPKEQSDLDPQPQIS